MERGVSAGLAVRNVKVIRGDRAVLDDVSLDVAPGEICALLGVSGAGKSTMLRAIAALEPLSAGTIQVGAFTLVSGPVPPQSRLHELRRQVGIVFQSASLFDHMTAIENVTLAPMHALGWPAERARKTGMDLLDSLGVAERADAYPRQLSGGEAQRVAIARALAPNPSVLLMDEPTSALDPARRNALGTSLRALARDGRALLIATHDVDFAAAYADRQSLLEGGRTSGRNAANNPSSGRNAQT
jgi:ABC-type polar amino acid transport system ATPase subunit